MGGLGAAIGPPVAVQWIVPNAMTRILAWVGILALLALKPNRSAQAWWIWAPLLAWMTIFWTTTDPEQQEITRGVAIGMSFGIAALWLLVPVFTRWRHVLGLGFVTITLCTAGFGMLAFATNVDMSASFPLLDEDSRVMWGACLCIGLAFAIGLTGAGLVCRKQYTALRAMIGLLLGLLGGWIITGALALPFMNWEGGPLGWERAIVGVTGATLFTFAAFLPFLILSFANPLYRERLKELLHVQDQVKSQEPVCRAG